MLIIMATSVATTSGVDAMGIYPTRRYIARSIARIQAPQSNPITISTFDGRLRLLSQSISDPAVSLSCRRFIVVGPCAAARAAPFLSPPISPTHGSVKAPDAPFRRSPGGIPVQSSRSDEHTSELQSLIR